MRRMTASPCPACGLPPRHLSAQPQLRASRAPLPSTRSHAAVRRLGLWLGVSLALATAACAQPGPASVPAGAVGARGGATITAASRVQAGALPQAAQRALAAAGVPAQALAAVALPLGHGSGAWGHQAELPMQPGSTMKLVTSVVALDQLGPGHRGHTTFRSAAPLEQGTLQGDLWLEGGADPELGVAAFWALLVELRAAGVTHIAGDLVVDRRLFNPARADVGLPPFDEGPEWPYNVVPDALGLAGSLLPVEIDSTSGVVMARTVPPLEGIEVHSRMALNAKRCADWEDEWQPPRPAEAGAAAASQVIELRGGFPRDCKRRVALHVLDRQQLTEALFRTLWAGLGGEFAGRVREAPGPAGVSSVASSEVQGAAARVLAMRQSRPWGEVLRGMNKASDNPLTRLLYLSLGATAGAPGEASAASPGEPTAARAERVVRQWFGSRGIATPGLVLDNGSGLSRSERITPLTLAQMLQAAWSGRYASDFMMSLPLAGEDGTMRHRLKDSPATGWARLKTGTLRNVAALAGYVRDAQGRPWAVAMMLNHDSARAARPALDALVDALARSRRPGQWIEGDSGPASLAAPARPHGEAR